MEPVARTISELTRDLKNVFAAEFSDLWVVGEIIGLKRHTSGHIYFSLKDSEARLSAVVFRNSTRFLAVPPDRMMDGSRVVCHGRLDVYGPQGSYSLIVDQMKPDGQGDLLQRLEALKKKLAAEGLFDEARKRPLPLLPGCIGIVTSPTSAAIQDMLTTIQKRMPVHIKLYPALVQGDGASRDIVRGLGILDRDPEVDVIILGRGGGAFEDLLPFSDEVVVRAVAACATPVISAVGHETDFPICDLAADLRAPTPTAAGNRVVPDRLELEETLRRRMEMLQLLSDRYLDSLDMRLMDLSGQAESLADHHLLTAQNRLARWQTALETSHPAVRLEQMAQKATGLALRLNEGIDRGFERVQARLESLGSRLHALGPRQALERGYAIALKQQGTIVMSPEQVKDGEGLRLMVKDGIIGVTVGEGT